MARFNIDMDGDMLHRFKETALKRRTTMSEIVRDLIDNYTEEQVRISIISHAIGSAITITAASEKDQDLSLEDKRALVIKNLVKATKEALSTISDMDVDEFQSEIKTPVIDTIFKHRASRYRQEQHRRSLVPLQTGTTREPRK